MALVLKIVSGVTNKLKIDNTGDSDLLIENPPAIPFISIGTLSGVAYTSTDLGENWNDVSFGPYTANYTAFSSFAVLSTPQNIMTRDRERVVIMSRNSANNNGLYNLSRDGGKTFDPAEDTGYDYGQYPSWTLDGSLRIGGWNGTNVQSADKGETLEDLVLPSSRIAVNFASSDGGQYVYGGIGAVGDIYYSSDYGNSWSTFNAGGSGSHMIVSCDSTGQYVTGGYGALNNDTYLSTDYGSSFSKLGDEGKAIITRDAGTIIFNNESSAGVFYCSTDQGSTFYQIASQFDSSSVIDVQYMDTNDNEIYLTKTNQKKILKLNSTKDGFEVYEVDNNIFGFSVSPFGRGAVYSNYNTQTPYKVWHTYDFVTWTEIYSSNTYHARYLNCF